MKLFQEQQGNKTHNQIKHGHAHMHRHAPARTGTHRHAQAHTHTHARTQTPLDGQSQGRKEVAHLRLAREQSKHSGADWCGEARSPSVCLRAAVGKGKLTPMMLACHGSCPMG